MPLTSKEKRQRRHIEETYEKKGYGPEKGRSVFYAMENKGTLRGKRKSKKRNMRRR